MQAMLKAARAAQKRAYAPYSKFKVGAAVRTADGAIYAGCNVENVAYPQGWCAEASAIAAMVGAGKTKIAECLVVGPGAKLITPCGGCRQKLAEFASNETPIHLCSSKGLLRTVTLGELLPMAFDF
ncbi:MAG TPA: cytidine deaminase [Reyranellaceae bacterium]|nr:cytidine deaminase [Reyranellaceae bacterium]